MKFPSKIIVTDQIVNCAQFSDATKASVIDFTQHLLEDFQKNGMHRQIVGIAGPSGSGKSTLSVLVKEIGKEISSEVDIVPISIDAFHFSNEYLRATNADGKNLITVKGRFDTYDVPALIDHLGAFLRNESISFPEYSRTLHEARGNAVTITQRPTLLLLEGLWLLYGEAGWGNVTPLLGSSFYIDDTEKHSRLRTIARHMFGGRTEEDAVRHYEESDVLNRALVIETRICAHRIFTWPA